MYSDWRCVKCSADLLHLTPQTGKCCRCASTRWRKWRTAWAWYDQDTGLWAVDEPPTLFSAHLEDAHLTRKVEDGLRAVYVLPDPPEDTIERVILTAKAVRIPAGVHHGQDVLVQEAL